MIARLILFIIVFLFILGGGHVAFYYSVIRFFSIESPIFKLYFAIALLILGISFFVSTLLLRLHVNFFTNIYYSLSAFWLGLLANLLMACATLWIAVGILKLLGHQSYIFSISSVVFSLTLVFCLYGVWKASYPKIKNIEIEIANLPSQLKGKKVVQLSDMHLGPVHRVSFLNDVVKKTNAQNPDLILITGDLFDGMDGALEPFIEPLSRLKAKDGVYFTLGNHEGYLGVDTALAILKQTPIKILQDEFVDINGLQLVGVNYPQFDRVTHPEEIFKSNGYDSNKPTILMYHTPTNLVHKNTTLSQQQWNAYWSPDLDFSYAKNYGVNLQLSGHAHKGQIFPFEFFAKLIYDKYYYGLHTDGSFNIYTSSGVGTWGPPMRTCSDSEIPVFTLI